MTLCRREFVLKKLALIFATVAALGGFLVLPAMAGPDDTVNATVTAVVISVNVSPNSISYGSQPLGKTNAVPSPMPLDVVNDGTVPVNFSIRGSDSQAWTLASSQGGNQFVHKFSTSGPTGTYTALTTSNQSLFGSSVAPAGVVNVDMRMDLPTSTASTAEQSTIITVVATQAP